MHEYINRVELNNNGYAHSIEFWKNSDLVGGLYGINIGAAFFGESMFSKTDNASKCCLLFLISLLIKNNITLLDSQFYNPHLNQFGAFEISDYEYQKKLVESINIKQTFKQNLNYEDSLSILQSLTHTS